MKYIITESQYKLLINETDLNQIYNDMVDGATTWRGTLENKITKAVEAITSIDEFYKLNDMFKDKKSGYGTFADMVRGEFDKLDSSYVERIKKKLDQLKVPYQINWDKFIFKILPKPVAATPAATSKVKKDWDKVKNYILSNGLPPEFPNKGELGNDATNGEFLLIKNPDTKMKLYVWNDGTVYVYPMKEGAYSDAYYSRSWLWDGTKPIIEGGFTNITKRAVGYAQTEEDIESGKKILYIGSSGDLVKKLQAELSRLTGLNVGCKLKTFDDGSSSYSPEDCDGIFGKNTKKAVKKYQSDNGLSDTSGIVGKETWDFLF
jgi:hypothetical protein